MSPIPQSHLVDAAEREKAANDLSTTYVVEAAAGTGKTTLLVSRILTIVRETPDSLSKVAAITFTEKAAGELKMRLRQELEQLARTINDDTSRYRKALLELDAMPVSTIHAFCRDMIHQRPVEAGVDPGFIVLDESGSRLLADEVWQTWLAEEFDGDCPAAQMILELGMSVESRRSETSLRSLFDLLIKHREMLDGLKVNARDRSALKNAVEEFRRGLEAAFTLREGCRNPDDTLFCEITKVETWYRAADWSSRDAALKSLLECPSPNRNMSGRKENWNSEIKEKAQDYFLKDFKAAAPALRADLYSHVCSELLSWLKQGATAYDEAKNARGLLDFHDLLFLARNMLLRRREARDYFKARFNYILVDEFQDTDPLQAEIVFFLAEKSDRFESDWENVELEPGRLFIVGDPKQSIYRFRRADLDLYGRVRSKIESDPFAECLQIRMNFRSYPVLVREVNAIFERWMHGPTDDRYEPEYAAMEPARRETSAEPRLILLPPPPSFDMESDSPAFIEAEAACLAEYIAEMIGTGRTITTAEGVPRPLEYRDIGILYPVTTHLSELENALKARGIPYQVTGGKNLPRRTEMIALTAVMNAIDNPYDNVNVAGALRSPFFGCSDDDLLAHRFAGGSFDYLSPQPEPSPLSDAFAVLRDLHGARRCLPPSETLAKLFDRTAGLFVFALKPQGEARVANLLKILDVSRSLESTGTSSFHGLVQWLNHLDELRVGEDESPASENTDDTIQLTTFHKAKGLEFPVVLLYHLSYNHRQHHDPLVNRTSNVIEWKSKDLETNGYSDLLEDERDREFHEARRLFYVAATRAREMLVIPAYWHKKTSRGETRWFTQMLESRCPCGDNRRPVAINTGFILHDTDGYDLSTPLQEGLLIKEDILHDAAGEPPEREQFAWQEIRDLACAALERSEMFLRPSAHESDAIWQTSSPIARTIEATRFGLFAHRLLHHVHLPGGENLEELSFTAADELSIPDQDRRHGCDLVRNALNSELFQRRINRAGGIHRELVFTAMVESRLVEGSMDLVFMEGGYPVVVDFKTDRITAAEAGQRAAAYRHQAFAYAAALKEITGTEPREVLFYFLQPGTIVSYTAADLNTSLV